MVAEDSVGLAASSPGVGLLVDLVKSVHLTPTQRSIVRTLVKHADRASYLSATEVAELAEVSQPSVTRFAAALGFEGYPQLRRAMREANLAPADPGAVTATEWQRSIDFELAAMQRVRDSLAREDEMREIAAMLVASKPLVVAGLRSASSVAQYFAYFAAQFLDDVRLVPSFMGGDLDTLIQAKAAGATSVFAVVFPRYAEDALSFLESAKELGLTVVCVTDSVASLAAGVADRILIAPVDSSLPFDSYAVPMIVTNVLLAAMTEVDVRGTHARLEQFEAVAERSQMYRA